MINSCFGIAFTILLSAAIAQADPFETCSEGRFKATAKFESCIMGVRGKLAGPGIQKSEVRFAKCRKKYGKAWEKLQLLTGTGCDVARYVDNGNGTITDNLSGLVWEKKSDDGSVHDKDNAPTWGTVPAVPDGTVFTAFLAGAPDSLNEAGFAGAHDWRLPSFAELQSIVLPDEYPCTTSPCVDAAFNSGCTGGCSVTGCSCTSASNYWSSTEHVYDAGYAWVVNFDDGDIPGWPENEGLAVRAVRGGLIR